MATYLTQTYIPQEKRQDTNFPLLAQVMQIKQGKYDANRAKIQQTLDAFGIQSEQVLRDSDKEYMSAKLSSIVDNINDYGTKDLSQIGVTENLVGSIKAAAKDPIIQSAIIETQKVNRYKAEVAKLKEKNIELYSDINFEDALYEAGYKEYMEGKTNKMGQLQYTPYSDYNKEIGDKMLDIISKRKGQTIEVPILDANGNPTGAVEKTQVNGLSPEQLRSIATTMITPSNLQQIAIDGRYSSRGREKEVLEAIQIATTEREKTLNLNIAQYETKLKGLDDKSEDAMKLSRTIDYLKKEQQSLQQNMEVFTKDPKAASAYLQREKVLNNFVTAYAPLRVESRTIVKDDVYFAQKNLEISQANLKLKFEKVSEERRKEQQKIEEQAQTNLGEFSVMDLGADTTETLKDIETEVENNILGITEEINQTVVQLRDALSREADSGDTQASEDLKILNDVVANKRENQSEVDAIREHFISSQSNIKPYVLQNQEGDKINLGSRLREQVQKFEIYNSKFQTEKKQQYKRHVEGTIDNEDYIAQIQKPEFDDVQIMWKGSMRPIQQVLKTEKIVNAQGIPVRTIGSNPELLDEIKRSYQARAAIEDARGSSATWNRENKYVEEVAKTFGETNVLEKEEIQGQDIVSS